MEGEAEDLALAAAPTAALTPATPLTGVLGPEAAAAMRIDATAARKRWRLVFWSRSSSFATRGMKLQLHETRGGQAGAEGAPMLDGALVRSSTSSGGPKPA